MRVKALLTLLALALCLLAAPAYAQLVIPGDDIPAPTVPEDLLPDEDDKDDAEPDVAPDDAPSANPPPEGPTPELDTPDYSRVSQGIERRERLNVLFERLGETEDDARAKLIAEEIWAIWTDSGSASVNFVLRRAASAQKLGGISRARAQFDTVTRLQPDFAEGWARSGRLAMDERDWGRAISDSIRALQLEPRHYHALWTLGSTLERLGRQDEALEAYREANTLYPALEAVKSRVEVLETEVEGDVL